MNYFLLCAFKNVEKKLMAKILISCVVSASSNRNCLEARKSATLDARNNSDTEVHIPECTEDGKYVKAQCDRKSGYCWCVNEKNGQPVFGTSKLREKPDCENNSPKTRTIKGCPERRKRKFLRELLEFLKKEKANVTDYSIKVSDSSFRQSEQEQLVRWKFTQIDTNVNRLLDRKEWKPFRRVMKEHKNLRKCGRKFLRFCDENTDRKITIQEWLDCFNLNEAGFGSSSTARKGPNPFDTYLKD
ncbi:SPARC-related modular calcium-binding protein 1 [Nymphon striatum]|nr:SPARC-related modular calcium-binding protein 1 [Nymphon striatum]